MVTALNYRSTGGSAVLISLLHAGSEIPVPGWSVTIHRPAYKTTTSGDPTPALVSWGGVTAVVANSAEVFAAMLSRGASVAREHDGRPDPEGEGDA